MELEKYKKIFAGAYDYLVFHHAHEMVKSGCVKSLGFNMVENCQDFRTLNIGNIQEKYVSIRYYNNDSQKNFVCTCGNHTETRPCLHAIMVGIVLMTDQGLSFDDINKTLKSDKSNFSLKVKKNPKTKIGSNPDTSRAKRPYYLSNFETITTELIIQNSPSTYVYESSLSKSYENVKFEYNSDDNSMTFFLESTNYYSDEETTVVQFRLLNNLLEVRCDEFTKSKKLQSAEIFVLNSIAKSPTPTLFHVLTKHENWISYIQKCMDRYQIENEKQLYEFFYLSFNPSDGLNLTFRDRILIPIDDTAPSYLDKLIVETSKNSTERSLPNHSNGAIIEKEYALAFFVIEEKNKYYPSPGIVAMVGILNKKRNGFVRKLVEYEENRQLIPFASIGENATELIDLLNQYNANFGIHNAGFNESSLRILELLRNEPFVYTLTDGEVYSYKKKDLSPLTVAEHPTYFNFSVSNEDKYLQLSGNFVVNNQIVDLKKSIRIDNNFWIYDEQLNCFEREVSKELLTWADKPLLIPQEGYDILLNKYILPLSEYYPIKFQEGVIDQENLELDIEKQSIYLSELNESVLIRPAVVYDGQKPTVLEHRGTILIPKSDKERSLVSYVRNEETEKELNELIASMHPSFQMQKGFKSYCISYSEFTKNMWFSHFFDKLQALDIEIFGLKELKKFKYSPHKASVSTSIKTNIDWFDISVNLAFGKEKIKLNTVRKAVLNKEKYIQLKDGSIGILPEEWLHKLEKYFRHATMDKEKLKLSKTRFSIVDELFEEIDDAKTLEEIADKKNRLRLFTHIEKTNVPKEVQAELRHYQKEGVNWMNFLDEMQWGGILADDMGLGKTLQVLTFLQQILLKNKTTNLIVVPTSLLFNWQREIEKFVPNLKIFFHYGTNREKNTAHFNKYDIIFSTYGIMLRDIEILKEYHFNYLILDESQAIKNPSSRRYKAACLLKSKNRIAMSGTPIENNTFDLFAQMSFVNPGIFGGSQNFKTNFSNPIDKGGDAHIGSELQRLINPFVLRRTKEMVASELPPKVEDVIYCEMGSEQRRIYDTVKDDFRNRLLEKVESDGVNKSKFLVLEGLTRLRQICDAPQLLNNTEITTTESVKINEIIDQITEKTGKHKILVFSQFTQMLGLVKNELAQREIDYEYLDGKSSTIKREKSVEQFQTNPDLRVFLISLKAGGTGLNLTAADYVYLLDPWWNPAAEAQAIDRCYRIGQAKSVFAYRMICKDTIEEKIVTLQNKKRNLASDIIHTDEDIMKHLDNKEIQNLFS